MNANGSLPLTELIRHHPGHRKERDHLIREACKDASAEFPELEELAQRIVDNVPGIGHKSVWRLIAAIGLALPVGGRNG